MATTDTKVSQLIINKLTQAQYNGITTPSNTELYLIDDGKTYVTTDMLAQVATTGSYTDLLNKPTNVSSFVNDAGYLTSIPTASANTLGGIKVGTGLSIDGNGVLSSTGLTSVDWSDITNKPSFATVATSGDYDDLIDTPVLATVATSGSYNDLLNKPTIPAAQVNSDWDAASGVAQILNKPNLATVATSGSYNDLTNKPSIPAAQVNSDWDAVSGVSQILNKPTIPAAQIQSDWTQADNTKLDYIKNKPSLATVATSGSYSDLSNKPTIPAAQVNSDWDAVSGVAQILNKPSLATVATSGLYSDLTGTPSLATVATSGSYNDLLNKPTIPTVNDATLTITQNGVSAGTFTANASSAATIALTDTTYSAFTGTDGNTAGTAGLVPAPATTDVGKYLKADGTWATVQSGTTYTAGANIDITSNVIDTADTVPLIGTVVSTPSPTVFVNTANIADGAVTSSKLAISSIIDIFYPVGSYYETSDTSFNPNNAWGGTWVEDSAGYVTVAMDTGTFATVGDTGGEETHTLTTAEMPSHTHQQYVTANSGTNPRSAYNGDGAFNRYPQCQTGATGGGEAHNNLQPYVVVKRWHRTA